MMIVRALTAIAKPALAGSVLTAAAAGGYFAIDHARNNDTTPFERVERQGNRLIVSEFGQYTDTITAVDPDHASDAHTTIATIDHADGFGTFPVLAPDGKSIAYTALPAATQKPQPDAPAQAAIVDADGGVHLLADDIDLLVPPVWSPDSQSIVVRKNTPADNGAGSFELILLGRDGTRTSVTTWTTAAVFPIGFSPDGGTLYYATLNAQGTDLYRVAPDGSGETQIAHLSDQIARDWKLSPDGAKVAYTVAESGAVPRVVTKTLDLATGAAAEAVAGGTGVEFNPAWDKDDTLTIASVKPQGGGGAVAVDASGGTTAITDSDSTIDLPLQWAPDGSKLAVRAVEGASPSDPGAGHVELVDGGGNRERVSENSDVLIVGWMR